MILKFLCLERGKGTNMNVFNRVSLASLEKLVKKINVTRQTIVKLFEFNKD